MLLHFYQPPTQEDNITWNILTFCYLPLLRMLDQKTGFGLTLNITGCLSEQLKRMKAVEFIELIERLETQGKIELVNSAKYHPIMPLFSNEVLSRQISIGAPAFFPPELAIDAKTLDFIPNKFVFIDESSIDIKTPIVRYKNKILLVNNREVCNLLRSYQGNLQANTVIDLLKDFTVSANDVELFGHHYTERLQVLSDLLDNPNLKFIKASEAIEKFGHNPPEVIDIKSSTWQDCEKFDLWDKNDLQKEYLELLKTCEVDSAYSSCYLYWLSNWPWWHPGLVRSGVELMPKSPATENFLKHLWDYHNSGQVEKNYEAFNKKVADRS
jgi:alpha-amylase/alpha-mannosidase (GH57 family)